MKYASLVTPVNFTGLKRPKMDTAPLSQLHSNKVPKVQSELPARQAVRTGSD